MLLEHLPFGENFTVSVQPQTSTTIGEETFLSVSTPSYWKSDDVSMICGELNCQNSILIIEIVATTRKNIALKKRYLATFFLKKKKKLSRVLVPDEVQGVDATVNHRVNNIFDVTVTWDSSEISPDFFIVETTSTGINASEPYIRNVSGVR